MVVEDVVQVMEVAEAVRQHGQLPAPAQARLLQSLGRNRVRMPPICACGSRCHLHGNIPT